MEYLGYTFRKPSVGKNDKWNYVDIEFNNSEEFNEATAKIMNILYKPTSDGHCVVFDGKGNNYLLEIVHATFDTEHNSIRVLPYDCKLIEPKPKTNANERKTNTPSGVTK